MNIKGAFLFSPLILLRHLTFGLWSSICFVIISTFQDDEHVDVVDWFLNVPNYLVYYNINKIRSLYAYGFRFWIALLSSRRPPFSGFSSLSFYCADSQSLFAKEQEILLNNIWVTQTNEKRWEYKIAFQLSGENIWLEVCLLITQMRFKHRRMYLCCVLTNYRTIIFSILIKSSLPFMVFLRFFFLPLLII